MVFECVEHVMLLCDMNQRIQSDSLSSTKTRVNWFLARPSWSCAVYEPSSSGDSWSNRISTRPSALLNLIWRCCRRQRIFIFLTDFSLLQRVLDPIPAAYGWRQGTALNESPAYCRALCEYWGFGALLKGTVEGVFAPLPATRTLSSFALGAPCLSAQPPPTDWATAPPYCYYFISTHNPVMWSYISDAESAPFRRHSDFWGRVAARHLTRANRTSIMMRRRIQNRDFAALFVFLSASTFSWFMVQ